ncbi:MAG: Nif3-like dinuclear metal center hexameric protein, partial [Phycisphaerales bacterium]
MKVKDIAGVVEKIAPLGLAQSWDNVGLLIGDPERPIRNILLTIDTTQAVVEEAKTLKTDLILAYHPVIWDGLKRIRPDDKSRTVYELIRS